MSKIDLILIMLVTALSTWMFGIIYGPAAITDPMNTIVGKALFGALYFGGAIFFIIVGLWAVLEVIALIKPDEENEVEE